MNSIRIYQSQEIFSERLIFVAGLVYLVALGGVCYVIGAIIECVWKFTEGEALRIVDYKTHSQTDFRPNINWSSGPYISK